MLFGSRELVIERKRKELDAFSACNSVYFLLLVDETAFESHHSSHRPSDRAKTMRSHHSARLY